MTPLHAPCGLMMSPSDHRSLGVGSGSSSSSSSSRKEEEENQ